MHESPPGDLIARINELERKVADLTNALEAANAALDELENAVDAKEAAATNASNAIAERVTGLVSKIKESTPGTGSGPAVSDNTPVAAEPDPAPWRPGNSIL